MKRKISKIMYLSFVFFILACDSKDKKENDSALVVERSATDTVSVKDPNQFIIDAAASGLLKIEAAKIAQKKGGDDMIKIFANHMVKENQEINKELETIIKINGIKTLTELSSSSVEELRKLDSVDNTTFDARYIQMMVEEHKKNVAQYMTAATLQDIKIKEFARKKLKDIESDAAMAADVQFNLTNKYAHFSK